MLALYIAPTFTVQLLHFVSLDYGVAPPGRAAAHNTAWLPTSLRHPYSWQRSSCFGGYDLVDLVQVSLLLLGVSLLLLEASQQWKSSPPRTTPSARDSHSTAVLPPRSQLRPLDDIGADILDVRFGGSTQQACRAVLEYQLCGRMDKICGEHRRFSRPTRSAGRKIQAKVFADRHWQCGLTPRRSQDVCRQGTMWPERSQHEHCCRTRIRPARAWTHVSIHTTFANNDSG